MPNKKLIFTFTAAMLLLLISGAPALAQSDTPKVELGVQFTVLRLDARTNAVPLDEL
jgi:hypothetical protein